LLLISQPPAHGKTGFWGKPTEIKNDAPIGKNSGPVGGTTKFVATLGYSGAQANKETSDWGKGNGFRGWLKAMGEKADLRVEKRARVIKF